MADKEISQAVISRLPRYFRYLGDLKEKGVEPCLAIMRVGERGDDISYETGAMKRADKVGIKVKQFLLPADASREQILDTIREINEDSSIHGCLMFRPLPDKKVEAEACALLDPAKDADSMTTTSLAGVFACTDQGYPPCTAEAVMEILDHYQIPLEECHRHHVPHPYRGPAGHLPQRGDPGRRSRPCRNRG